MDFKNKVWVIPYFFHNMKSGPGVLEITGDGTVRLTLDKDNEVLIDVPLSRMKHVIAKSYGGDQRIVLDNRPNAIFTAQLDNKDKFWTGPSYRKKRAGEFTACLRAHGYEPSTPKDLKVLERVSTAGALVIAGLLVYTILTGFIFA